MLLGCRLLYTKRNLVFSMSGIHLDIQGLSDFMVQRVSFLGPTYVPKIWAQRSYIPPVPSSYPFGV